MTLPLDVSRCTGCFDLRPDAEWCPERDTCQRYLAWSKLDAEAGIPDYKGIPVEMAHRECEIKIEHEPSFNDRIEAAGIKTIRTGEHDRMGREIILLELNGEQMRRPATPGGAVDEIKEKWGIEI